MATEQHDKRPRKAAVVAAEEHAPWKPTPWENADALSVQRWSRGEANAIEQQRAFRWVLRATSYLDEPFRPGGEDGRRNTDFALGKAHVGREIAKLINIDLSQLRGKDERKP